MPEQDQPLQTEDIVQSAEKLSVVSAFATGENASMLEAARQMPEYRELITAYARYCIDTLRDKRVAGYFKDKSLAFLFDEYPHIWISLQEREDQYQVKFGMSRSPRHVFEKEKVEEEIADFEQFAKARYAPTGIDSADTIWVFNYKDEFDHYKPGGNSLVRCRASRDLQPVDFLTYPQLLKPFVLSIKEQMTVAEQRILQNGEVPVSDSNQRVSELVDALKRANEILAPVFEPQSDQS